MEKHSSLVNGVFNKRNRWIITLIMAIASLAFTAIFVVPVFVAAFQNPQTTGTTASPNPLASGSPQADLEAQAKGYELVLQREPDNQTALRGLLEVRIQQGNLQATIEPLQKLAALNPDQPDYKVLLAQIKQRLGDREGAAQAYREVLSSRPGDMNALQGLVNLLLDQGRPQAAIGMLQDTLQTANEANNVQPGSVDVSSVQLLLAQVYAEQKRYDEAIAVYDQIIGLNSQDFRPLLGKAIVLQTQGKTDEAQPLFSSAAALAPDQFKDQINQIASGQATNPLGAENIPTNPSPATEPASPPTTTSPEATSPSP
jgi:tetratricopeptide (TPR) repeat protein